MLANQLFATKFQAPPLRASRVVRQRLLQKLEQGYNAGSRLTLVCAPAGYGKTTLVVEWLQQGRPFAWLSLDESENDPSRFFTCLVNALQTVAPGLGASTLSLLSIPQPAAVETLAGELINEISQVEQPFLLVLDDYHHIHASQIHDVLDLLLSHLPPNLHLVITTREDPAFPLGRLRARGQLTEIRARELRFTEEEVRDFLHLVHQLDLPDPAIERLLKVTEGWAAGLQLTGLAIQNEEGAADPDQADAFIDTFSGTHQYIIEYLLEEVLRRQPEEIRRFLAQTAILERFNLDLCAALTGDLAAAQSALTYLEHANLFLTPLTSTNAVGANTWYRYHRLFADVLRSALDPQSEQAMHHSAARWFEAHQLPDEAMAHYLAAGEAQSAGRLVCEQAPKLLAHGEINTLLHWSQALPVEDVRQTPGLLAAQALGLLLTGQLGQASELLRLADEPTPAQPRNGPLLAVKGWLMLVCGQGDHLQELAQQAIALLAPEETIYRVLALLVLGTAFNNNHNLGASSEAFQEAYQLGLRMDHPFGALSALANLLYNLLEQGQIRKAKALCLDTINHFSDARGKPLPITGILHIPLSSILLEQHDLAQAKDYARSGQAACQRLFSSGMMGGDAEVVLATIASLEGDLPQALAITGDMRRFAAERRITFLEDKLLGVEADLHLRSGNLTAARDCMERLELHGHHFTPAAWSGLSLLKVQMDAAEGRSAEALELLDQIDSLSQEESNLKRRIYVLAIRARLLNRLGRRAEALVALEQAVRLASPDGAPDGYLHTLLRAGLELAQLLPEIRAVAPAFVDRLLAIEEASRLKEMPLPEEAPAAPQPENQKPAPAPAPDLAEPLSEQERNVLRLLAAGLSNQEIAEQLVISPGTAKWHVHNILGKLGAASRSQAAAKARESGLA